MLLVTDWRVAPERVVDLLPRPSDRARIVDMELFELLGQIAKHRDRTVSA
ncbi:MAG: hypothetical protein ACRDYA_19335 [Egibacteraceae bacterium]